MAGWGACQGFPGVKTGSGGRCGVGDAVSEPSPVLQEASCKNHRVNRVVFLGSTKRLLTTGVSRWNTRQIALWDQVGAGTPRLHPRRDPPGSIPTGMQEHRDISLNEVLFAVAQEDLAMPLIEEEIDGLSGLLFPFYDADTHMLYLAGKVRGCAPHAAAAGAAASPGEAKGPLSS